FSVLTGLCWAMEPICGQAYGANNHKLLHKTLLMTVILLLLTTLPISLLWLYTDKILTLFGQNREITALAKNCVLYLLPDLLLTSFLAPLKAYLSSQSKTLPIMFSSGVAVAFHLPFNIFLSKIKGIEGVALATALTDLSATIMLAFYVLATESWIYEGWWKQQLSEWTRLLTLSAQCCFSGCLEWWCYEILILLAGRTQDAQCNVAVLTLVLNFDYFLYGVMVSLSTCASTRVSNELAAAGRAACSRPFRFALGVGGRPGVVWVIDGWSIKAEWGNFCFSQWTGGRRVEDV
ncbi:protein DETOXIFICATION 56-like, partial [Asparagus officinalis]|uniref:protein DETOXIFICATION 56-like n=1 Tax=Asparagus officinalis TaxID=4686 RepID=UPI00098E7F12